MADNNRSLASGNTPERNVFADRMVRDVIAQVSLVLGLIFLVWFFTSNFLSQEGGTNWQFLFQPSKVGQPAPPTLPTDKSTSVAGVYAFGLLNTVIVAALGIVIATGLGFTVGVLRLSKNVLLSRLAQIYIEGLRNIPLAVQLLFLNSLLLTLPGIATDVPITAFGGLFHNLSFDFPSLQFGTGNNEGTWLGIVPFDYVLLKTATETGTNWLMVIAFGVVFVSLVAATFFYLLPRLTAWADPLMEDGLRRGRTRQTIANAILAVVLSLLILLFFAIENSFPAMMGWSMLAVFFIAILLANAVRVGINNWADDKMDATGVRPNVNFLSWAVFVGIVAAIFIAVGGPISLENFIYNNKGRAVFGFSVPVSMIALIGSLAIYTSAFIAEIVRAGIQSVYKGQREAAAALGLRNDRIMNLIIIPQALKVIVPPLNSQYMNLAKNSSLAFILKYPDLVNVLNTTRNNTGRELEVAIIILLSYLAISLTISVAMNYVNSRVQLVER